MTSTTVTNVDRPVRAAASIHVTVEAQDATRFDIETKAITAARETRDSLFGIDVWNSDDRYVPRGPTLLTGTYLVVLHRD